MKLGGGVRVELIGGFSSFLLVVASCSCSEIVVVMFWGPL